ncbi:hypothetical protein D7I39_11085 [Allopusillimonas ginsengisoli]|nr:hypothetical protein D7I39_11085 [Allopusillimonas ginsengisoli]
MLDIEQKQRLRPIAREKAQWFSEALAQAGAAGRNVGQASIDLQDEIEIFAKELGESDEQAFLSLYIEELNALTEQKSSEADTLIMESVNNSQVLTIIIGVVIFAVLLAFIFNR